MSDTSYVFRTAHHSAELSRLHAIESIFDGASRRCLLATGLRAGWKCLEVGAGAGSIATWFADVVGETGRVLAVDANPRFLPHVSQLQVVAEDIQAASLEPESFDLVHTRFVLIHIPEWPKAFGVMVAALRPGGWIVLEEPDFSMSRSVAGRADLRHAFDNVHRAIASMFRERHLDYAFGARLCSLLEHEGFVSLSIESEAPIVSGGSPQALMMAMSTAALRDKYVATGLANSTDVELYEQFAADPTCWATYYATVRAVGRKPR